MTTARAEQLISISLIILLGSSVGNKLILGKTDPHVQKNFGTKIVSGFMAILFASIIAEIAPTVGAVFAISTAGYAFFDEGLPAINSFYSHKNSQVSNTSNQFHMEQV